MGPGKQRTAEAGTRLTAERFATPILGDAVTIESGADFNRTSRGVGTVTRVTGTKVFVRVKSGAACPASSVQPPEGLADRTGS